MIERRKLAAPSPIEARVHGAGIAVRGYAAVFNVETVIAGSFREVIRPGAFTEAIQRDDVPLLFGHDGIALARNVAGTLRLAEDDVGLRIDATLDSDSPAAQEVISAVRRGDVDQMSFAFLAKVQDFIDDDEELPLRILQQVSLFDVSIVNQGAYTATNVALTNAGAAP